MRSTTFPSGSATCSVRSPHGRSVSGASTGTPTSWRRALHVDVVDEERDLALRPRLRVRGRVATDQRGQLAARKHRELCPLGRELRVGVSATAQRHSNDIAIEADRSVEIAHEQNRVAKTGRHASMFAPAAASNALSDEFVVAPGLGPSNHRLGTLPF
jgi:hypothetical protein